MKYLTLWILFCGTFLQQGKGQNNNEADSLIRLLPTMSNDTNKVWVYKKLASIYLRGKPFIGKDYAQKGVDLAYKLEFKQGETTCLIGLGLIYNTKAEYALAFQSFLKAFKIAETTHNKKDIRIIMGQLSGVYRSLGDYEKALETNFKVIKLAEEINVDVWSAYRGTGETYLAMNRLDSALFYTQKAYDNLEKNGNNIHVVTLTTLGDIYKQSGEYNLALSFYQESIKNCIKSNNTGVLCITYGKLAELYKQNGKRESSIFNYEKELALAIEGGYFEYINSSSRFLASAYDTIDPLKALKYYRIATSTADNVFNKDNFVQFQKIRLHQQQEQQKLVQEQENDKNKIRLIALLASLGFFLAIALLLYRNNRQKQKTNAVLENTLTELKETQTQLIEKEKIASLAAVRLQEIDALKTRLYTNITHEFRTPLTVILGMTQQIKDKPAAYLQEGLNMITRSGQNLLNLVNQMLDLSKLESGHLSLHYQQGDVVNFMKYIVESLHSLAESKGLQIHFISDLEQLTMDYDETHLQQVVSNLLSNAVKFTPKGGNIYVSLSIQSQTFSFKVKDTGVGIAEADLPLIFDRFYQVDDTATRHGEGTGIGLSLTRELVKLMNGTISVKSQQGKGTEFQVVLPIHHVADKKAKNEQLSILTPIIDISIADDAPLSINQEFFTEKPLVLIADDNADVRAYISSCLSTDYNLLIAKDGQECEELAFEHTPDLIISDVMMPFKDGFEVCQTLKTDERTSHIPIIMLTAKADIDSKLQGLEHGADVYLMKPFNKEELLLRIKKLLELRQQLQQYYRSTMDSIGFVIARNEATEGGKRQTTEKIISSANNADNAFVIKVRTLIEVNLNNSDFDVERLCRDLLLSPSQVHRKLTALTGLSTNNFIRYVRLLKAKEELVQNAHFSIAAVAYDCGFNDPAYFSRAFKQEFGVTPQAWREQTIE